MSSEPDSIFSEYSHFLFNEPCGPHEMRELSFALQIVSANMFSKARPSVYFDGVVNIVYKKNKSGHQISGDMWIGNANSQWVEPLAATIKMESEPVIHLKVGSYSGTSRIVKVLRKA